MTFKPRTLGMLAFFAAVALGLLYVTFREDPVPVDLHLVTGGPMQVTIDADGKTRIRDIYEVASPITGTAQRSPVKVGDTVEGGKTVVAVVRPAAPSLLDTRSRTQAEAAIREAEASLHVAQTGHAQAVEEQTYAQSQFNRTSALVEREVLSQTHLEAAAQKLAIANASVEAAEANIDLAMGTLERARAALIEPTESNGSSGSCCIELHAPADGRVLSVQMISERPVLAGAPLLSIGDPANLELVADLLSSDAVRIAAGAPAIVERWGGPDSLSARLTRIEPSARTKVSALGIEEQRVDAFFDLVSSVEERPGLGDGFSVFLRIIEWQADDVVQVPLSAIFKRDGEWGVFVITDGKVAERTVSLGRRNDRFAQVLDGLEPDELVITHPSDEVAEGRRIIDRKKL